MKAKSRVKWFKEGDDTLKFFHRVADGRRKRKFINSLESKKGLILNNMEVILEEILNFFGKLYSKPAGISWRLEGLEWSPILERVLLG